MGSCCFFWGGGGGGSDTTVTTLSELHRLIFIIIQDYKTHVDNKDQGDTVTMSYVWGKGFNWEFVKRKRTNQK